MKQIKCPDCGSTKICKDGFSEKGEQYYRCNNPDCSRKNFKEGSKPIFGNLNIKKEENKSMKSVNSIGMSLQEFREKNDTKVIIKNGLSKLQKDKLYKTEDFKILLGIPNNFGTKKLLELGMLDNYHGKCRGELYWSHPETIKQLKFEALLV